MFREKKSNSFAAFLLGAAAATVVTLLYAPKSGKELRADIKKQKDDSIKKAKDYGDKLIKDTKKTSDDLLAKGNELLQLVKKYAAGEYMGPVEKIEREIRSLRAAINAAVESYKHKTNGSTTEKALGEIFTEASDRSLSEFDDESLPKHESMRKRRES